MTYTGTVDETAVSDLIVRIGEAFQEAGDLGFVLTYHAARGDDTGRMTLVGSGISQDLLTQLLQDALDANAEHGYTL